MLLKLARLRSCSLLAGVLTIMLLACPAVLQGKAGSDKSEGKPRPTLAGPKVDHSAQGKNRQFNGQNRPRGDALHEALKSIDLTEAQKQQIQTIIIENRAARTQWQKANHERLQALLSQLKAAQEAKESEKAGDIQKQIREIRRTMPQASQATPLIRKVLTADQLAAVDAKIKEIQESRRAARKAESSMMMGGKADKNKSADNKGKNKGSKGKEGKLDL